VALAPALAIDAFILIAWLVPLAYVWHRYPKFFYSAVFHHGKAHALLIGFLSAEGFYQTLLALIFLLAFSLMLWLPRYYFWNRRAARLRREPPSPETATDEAVTADISIWPPAPKRPMA